MPNITFNPASTTTEDYPANAEVPKTKAFAERLRKLENKVPRRPVSVKDIDRLIDRTHAHYAKRPR